MIRKPEERALDASHGQRDRGFAFLAMVLTSCGSPPTPVVPVERPLLVVAAATEPADARSAPPASRAAAASTETWEGEYTCTQGITALTLHVTRRDDSSLDAVFMFRASEKNPGVPSGAYTLVGQMRPDGSFELTPSRWIDRPGSYIMVGMAGDVDAAGTIMRGRITEDACGGFELHRERTRAPNR